MKCSDCWRKASWNIKIMIYGNTFYKHICNYHFLKDEISSWDINQTENKKLGGKNNAVIK
ncbi:hypothetical protein [Spiroplasma endosymbiont of Polydrusus pterygomalis]|uniref:hypothetical protein n=1 Tax=Spiroplasma endosymbiont of Polydrusus pterygomalis TaxID=3139327 RepID=UPI003CCB3066